jgi:hypothetical protein
VGDPRGPYQSDADSGRSLAGPEKPQKPTLMRLNEVFGPETAPEAMLIRHSAAPTHDPVVLAFAPQEAAGACQ